MTPFQLFREAPVRLRALPTLWKVLLCSAASTTLAVVLMAWQAHRFCMDRHLTARAHDAERRIEHDCAAFKAAQHGPTATARIAGAAGDPIVTP
jgi:hypothetical protein